MPAGAVKVLYNQGCYAKWIPPAAFGEELKRADFMAGDAVSVFCPDMGLWLADGLVVEVLSENSTVDGGSAMPAGSVKVVYASRSLTKWISPVAFGIDLRAQRGWSALDIEEDQERRFEVGKGGKKPESAVSSHADRTRTPDPAAVPGEQAQTLACTPDACTASAAALTEGGLGTSGEQDGASSIYSNTSALSGLDTSGGPCTASPLSMSGSEAGAVSRFCVGDAVCVLSRGTCAWLRDGVVVRVLAEPAVVNNDLPMPAGAVKVLYNQGCYAKWIPPAAFGEELKRADFMAGDAVSVFCPDMGLWLADGLVVEVLSENSTVDGGSAMPAGSVKVVYASGNASKWIPPDASVEQLRPQRQWSGEGMDDQSLTADGTNAGPAALGRSEPKEASVAAQMADNLVRSFSHFIMGCIGSQTAPQDFIGSDGDDDDAYIVSGAAGIPRSILGRYRRVGEHGDRPMYRNEHGAIIFCDEHWKMNSQDDTSHWCYEVKAATGDLPPTEAWEACQLNGGSTGPVPTVTNAVDVEVLVVSGAIGPSRAVNGRYGEVGWHNARPKYKNGSGAIVFFDDCWKINPRDDVLAWNFWVNDAVGSQPPAGEWEAHWSVGHDQPPACVRVRGALAPGA